MPGRGGGRCMESNLKKSGDAVLVVGADSDIGAALIKTLSGNIIAHFFAAGDKLSELDSSERRIFPVYGDLSSHGGISDFIALAGRCGLAVSRIVHLPSSPAMPSRLPKFDPERYLREINIQVVSAAMIFGRFLPEMAKNKFGRVAAVLTSYCIGTPPKYLTAYVSAKYALMGLLKSAAVEYAGKGVTVNAVAPSMTETKFLATLPDFEIEANAKASPMGRNAVPEDIVPVLKFLIDGESPYLTGAVIPVTGGSVFF